MYFCFSQAPQMPRLGLLAAAFSNGTIGVYSLPHPEALAAHHQSKGEETVNCITCAYFFSGVTFNLFICSIQVHLKWLFQRQSKFSFSWLLTLSLFLWHMRLFFRIETSNLAPGKPPSCRAGVLKPVLEYPQPSTFCMSPSSITPDSTH